MKNKFQIFEINQTEWNQYWNKLTFNNLNQVLNMEFLKV